MRVLVDGAFWRLGNRVFAMHCDVTMSLNDLFVGYLRIFCALCAFQVARNDAILFFAFYFVSSWADVADGYFARKLNQSSRFGAVLDMITDRCATACLCVVLATFWPVYTTAFCFLIALDFTSHYARMYSTMLANKASHKSVEEGTNALLKFYYSNRLFLGFMCAGNEGFYLFLYMTHFYADVFPITLPNYGSAGVFVLFTYLCAPVFFVKQFINILQLLDSSNHIAEFDVRAYTIAAEYDENRPATPTRKAVSPSRSRSPGRRKML